MLPVNQYVASPHKESCMYATLEAALFFASAAVVCLVDGRLLLDWLIYQSDISLLQANSTGSTLFTPFAVGLENLVAYMLLFTWTSHLLQEGSIQCIYGSLLSRTYH